MPQVTLTGWLVCRDDNEASIVLRHLPRHIELTRAEAGCVSFDVTRTTNPLVWQVDETFVDAAAFEGHQARVAASEWGKVTRGIERRYTVEGAEAEES